MCPTDSSRCVQLDHTGSRAGAETSMAHCTCPCGRRGSGVNRDCPAPRAVPVCSPQNAEAHVDDASPPRFPDSGAAGRWKPSGNQLHSFPGHRHRGPTPVTHTTVHPVCSGAACPLLTRTDSHGCGRVSDESSRHTGWGSPKVANEENQVGLTASQGLEADKSPQTGTIYQFLFTDHAG